MTLTMMKTTMMTITHNHNYLQLFLIILLINQFPSAISDGLTVKFFKRLLDELLAIR